MANFSANVSATGTSYPASPNAVFGFDSRFIQLTVETATSAVLWSFDGIQDHGKLIGTTGPHTMEIGRKQMWFRVASGTDPANVRVTVWNL